MTFPNPCTWRTASKCAVLAFSMAALSACTLPTQGPSVQQILDQSETQEYELVPITDAVASHLSARGRQGFSSQFLNAPLLTSNLIIGVGDRLNIRIFEAGRGGLFSNDSGNGTVNLPNITVGPDGLISLPYAGTIQARGQTPRQIELAIVDVLQGKAIEPQATVVIAANANNNVTVTGAVVRPTILQLSLRGERLSAALVASGGTRTGAHENSVKITRKGRSSTASLERIQTDSRQNIALRNGDTITVLHRPESYTIMGSVNRPGDVPFTEPKITLLEAIGQASGLLDARADPGSVFLFRRENQRALGAYGVARKPWWGAKNSSIPTVYILDFKSPKALFLAQTTQMRDGDTIYVANASAVGLRKALVLFGLGLSTATDVQTLIE